jgi:hypothetical protein
MADNVLVYPTTCLTRVPRRLALFSVLRALVQVAVLTFDTREYVKGFSMNEYRACLQHQEKPETIISG